MITLTKEQILACDDLPQEVVECPEWGGDVFVRTMAGTERDDLDAFFVSKQNARSGVADMRGFKVRLVQLTVLNEDGTLMFDCSDIPALQKKSAAVVERIAQVAMRLNGFASGQVEDLLGNLPTDPSDSSGSS
jgi:hypothetical protein